MQDLTATKRHGVTRKKRKQHEKNKGKLIRVHRKNVSINSGPEDIYIIGQRKAFCR